MKQTRILHDPLPIGRMGIRKEDQSVIVANDYSCFAQMLEEYISYGAIQIVIPQSEPETKTLEQMPTLLRRRIHLIDDSSEIETVNRVFHLLRKEFDVKINEEYNNLIFQKDSPRDLIESIEQVHSDLKKIAIGFNHDVQPNINVETSKMQLRLLRTKVSIPESRYILADLEAFLNQYEEIKFNAITPPKKDAPRELITIFDRLLNDPNYIQYSDLITQISKPQNRETTLVNFNEIVSKIRSRNYIAEGWDFVSKAITVWTGIPIPQSKTISSLISSHEFPVFINMDPARKRAVEMWRSSSLTSFPLRRDGLPISDNEVSWIPPLDGMKVKSSEDNYFTLGTVGELLKALEDFRGNVK